MAVERAAAFSGIELGLSYLDRVIATGGESVAMPRDAAEELSASVDTWRPGAPPQGLVARPCPMSAARWHLDRLLTAMRAAGGATQRAQRIYHARMLGFLLAPERPQFRPPVTVLIPVHNRARQCAESVESCLAQDWRPLEVLVVDDGSTDDLAGVLRPFGDQVRLLRKPNGGVASARNAGIAAARGDFIHYLDSDDILLPDAIARKVEAFAAIADAELCYTLSDDRGSAQRAQVPPPSGTRHCPTHDLMRIVAIRYPFIVSTMMLTRWTALDTAPFEEDLRRSSDVRYNVGLGLRGTKVIGLVRRLTARHFTQDGLTGTATFDPVKLSLIRLRDLRDMLTRPSGWQYAARYLRRLVQQRGFDQACRSGDPRIGQAIEEVIAAVRALAKSGARDGLSTLPLIASLRHECRRLHAEGCWRLAAGNPLAQLPELFSRSLEDAAPIGVADLAFWSDGPGRRGDRPAIHLCLRTLARRYGGDPAILDAASWLLRRSQAIPDRRSVKVLVFLHRWLRSTALARNAALLAARHARSSA